MDTLDVLRSEGCKVCDNQHPFGLSESRAYLIHNQAAFACLLFDLGTLVFIDGKKSIPTAATDGEKIFINMEYWKERNVPEAAFLLGHEVIHIMLEHPKRMAHFHANGFEGKEFDSELYNDAADYVINDMLIEAKCGRLPPNGLHDRNIATRKDMVDTVYRKLYKQKQQSGQAKKPSSGQGQGGPKGGKFDRVMPASPKAPSKGQIDRAVASAIETAKTQGGAAAGILRSLQDVLEPQIDWRRLLHQAFHTVRGRDRTTWKRLNRKFMASGVLMPGRDGTVLGTVVVGIDTSGSVGQKEAEAFLAETHSILKETRPKVLWVVPCDTRVANPKKLSNSKELLDYAKAGLGGGGGTSFVPVFDWVAKKHLKPEVFLYCTDMMGSFPKRAPDYPVIWVSTGTDRAPFGKVIKLTL